MQATYKGRKEREGSSAAAKRKHDLAGGEHVSAEQEDGRKHKEAYQWDPIHALLRFSSSVTGCDNTYVGETTGAGHD
jgi:hypothetical protein